MQVQGSGIVEFKNGERKLLAYAGSNKHEYKSIGKLMIQKGFISKEDISLLSIQQYFADHPDELEDILNYNPSYVFFKEQESRPKGAGNVPLTAKYTIAVDRSIIPLGACLLAYVPVLDGEKRFSHHEYRILISQDVGGAIKGAGHVDLYMGIGEQAKNQASNLHHYGQVWLLLPQKE